MAVPLLSFDVVFLRAGLDFFEPVKFLQQEVFEFLKLTFSNERFVIESSQRGRCIILLSKFDPRRFCGFTLFAKGSAQVS